MLDAHELVQVLVSNADSSSFMGITQRGCNWLYFFLTEKSIFVSYFKMAISLKKKNQAGAMLKHVVLLQFHGISLFSSSILLFPTKASELNTPSK